MRLREREGTPSPVRDSVKGLSSLGLWGRVMVRDPVDSPDAVWVSVK